MKHFDMIGLTPLLGRTAGRPDVRVCLIDGPVEVDHPALRGGNFLRIASAEVPGCRIRESRSCTHGTFIAGMLAAGRSERTPGICPNCTFLLHPIFAERPAQHNYQLTTSADTLAEAIFHSVQSGADILNLSVNVMELSSQSHTPLSDALQFAAERGVITVAAASNIGVSAQSVLTNHPWVVPVVGASDFGGPLPTSILAPGAGKRGVSAPGEQISSATQSGPQGTLTGTSAAAAFVTGAIALIWSEVPHARAVDLRSAITLRPAGYRPGVFPPMVNAWAAYQALRARG